MGQPFEAVRSARIGKNFVQGLYYALKTERTVFSDTDRPRPANNVFINLLNGIALKASFVLIEFLFKFKSGVRVRFTVSGTKSDVHCLRNS